MIGVVVGSGEGAAVHVGRLTITEFLAVLGFVAGLIIWAVRLEGRVDTQQTQLNTQRENHALAIEQLRDDIGYIRRRLDLVLDRTP